MPRALAALLLVLGTASAAPGGPLVVVATSTDLKALVEVVGGDRVAVESLTPPLADPHAVTVKPGQLARLKTAALLVRIGLDHEPWLAPALRTVGGGPADLDASRGLRLLQTETPRVRPERGVHLHAFGNTHYWLDPENARPITRAIADALAGLAPADRAALDANRARFLTRLDAGMARWTKALAPHRGARLVVAHETWTYFAERFGLRLVAAVEPTPGVPPTPASLEALAGRMRGQGVRLIVAEPHADQALVGRLATLADARVVTLVPSVGGDPAAGDYLALFDLNVGRLAAALARAR